MALKTLVWMWVVDDADLDGEFLEVVYPVYCFFLSCLHDSMMGSGTVSANSPTCPVPVGRCWRLEVGEVCGFHPEQWTVDVDGGVDRDL